MEMLQGFQDAVVIDRGGYVVGYRLNMRGCISHGNPQTYVLQHRDIVAAVSKGHGILQVDAVESQHLVDAVAFAVSSGNDVGKERMPAHRFAVRKYGAENLFVLIFREVAHDLQDFLVSGCFNGEDFRNADVDESGNLTDRLKTKGISG